MAFTYEMTEAESKLFTIAKAWIISKLEAQEGFSVLLVTAHADGKRMTKFTISSVDDALAKCKSELGNELKDATDYVLVFNARVDDNGKMNPLIIFQMEHRSSACSMRIGQLYELKKSLFESRVKFQPIGEFQYIGPSDS